MTNQHLRTITRQMMVTGLFHDEHQAIDIFQASLRALRNRLPKVEAYHLGTKLPLDMRDDYFANWPHNVHRQTVSVNKSEFLAEVAFHLHGHEDHSLDELVPVALNQVLRMVSENEAENVKHSLPRSMRDIFNDSISMD